MYFLKQFNEIKKAYIEKEDGKNAALEINIPELKIRKASVSLAICIPNSLETFLKKIL